MANEIHDHASLTPEPGISKRLLLKQTGLHVLGLSALTSGVVSLVGNGQANAQEPAQISERTGHLLELMRKGDDAFNAHDFGAMKAVHHPDMIAYVTGNPQPLYGRDAHAAAMGQFFSIFPDVHVDNDPYPHPVRKWRLGHRGESHDRDVRGRDATPGRHNYRPDRREVRCRIRPDVQMGR